MSEQENPNGLKAGMFVRHVRNRDSCGLVRRGYGSDEMYVLHARERTDWNLSDWEPVRIAEPDNLVISMQKVEALRIPEYEWKVYESWSDDSILALVAKARRHVLDLNKPPAFNEPTEATSLIRVARKDGTTTAYIRNDDGRWVAVPGPRHLMNSCRWKHVIHNAIKVEVLYAP